MTKLKDELRHTGVGFLLGLLGVIFGIFWAVHLTVNHESIHRRLLAAQASSIEDKFVINTAPGERGHEGHGGGAHSGHEAHSGQAGQPAHDGHSGESGVEEVRAELDEIRREIAQRAPVADHHGSPEMAEAHNRLGRAHAHAMGLGILSVAVSLLLALIPASARAKTFAAACVGTGGVFYPLSWILMGMRTTALGIGPAAESVVPMVGLSVILIGLGLFLTLVFLIRWLLFRD